MTRPSLFVVNKQDNFSETKVKLISEEN